MALWDALIAAGAVPCGLGARDALRLEVCYPLHGNDITQETNAIEAGLGWVCARDKHFVGSDVLERTREEGPRAPSGGAAHGRGARSPRPGCPILDAEGSIAGEVTSGTLSPTLQRGIGLGYVRADARRSGHRDQRRRARARPRRARSPASRYVKET